MEMKNHGFSPFLATQLKSSAVSMMQQILSMLLFSSAYSERLRECLDTTNAFGNSSPPYREWNLPAISG